MILGNYNRSLEEDNISLMNLFQPNPITTGVVSDYIRNLFREMIRIWLVSTLGYVGIIANAVAIITFFKQGFRETVNITLTSIAFWDLLKCIFAVLQRLHTITRHFSAVTTISVQSITNYGTFYLFGYCNHVSCILAGYLAIERCLCVSRPFHVKFLLSPKNIAFVNLLTSLVIFGSIMVLYIRYQLAWVQDPTFNATVVIVAVRMFRSRTTVSEYYDVISILYPLIAFVIICVCTAIMYYYLRKSAEFRANAVTKLPKLTSTRKINISKRFQLSSRDRRIIKLLLIIMIIYILNIFPRLLRSAFRMFIPGFRFRGQYSNFYDMVTYFMDLFDLINGVVNPFIYFFMSSEFKKTVIGMFCKIPKT